jgi:hypothetical protein
VNLQLQLQVLYAAWVTFTVTRWTERVGSACRRRRRPLDAHVVQ